MKELCRVVSSDQVVVYEREDRIAKIILNRPGKLNALNSAVVQGLHDAWRKFENDDEARVAILTGSGSRAFSAGVDLNDPPELGPAFPGVGVNVTKPVIAAIEGYCLGGGFVLAMLCDLRVAAEDAVLGYPEAKVGLMGGIGPALVNFMPRAIALEMLFSGENFPAQRLYEVGFLNRVVPKGETLLEAQRLAEVIAANAPLVLKGIKRLAGLYPSHDPVAVGAVVSQVLRPIMTSEDAREGMAAFKERRQPNFSGR